MAVEFNPVRIAIRRLPENARPQGQGAGHAQGLPTLAEAPQDDYQNPLIDIHEDQDGLILEADLPGVADDSVTIQLEDNVLNLHAKVRPALPESASLLHEEFLSADFKRSFILSDEVDREKISAELKNGVLRLTLPKADRTRTRRIEIKSS